MQQLERKVDLTDTRRINVADPERELSGTRVHARLKISRNALLHCRDFFSTVRIIDVSRGGVGLDKVPNVFIDDEVKIELINGCAVNGIVRWWLAGKCGVEFLDDVSTEFHNSLAPNRHV